MGLISDSAISDATPAAFFAKSGDPLDTAAIAAQLADAPVLDLIPGRRRGGVPARVQGRPPQGWPRSPAGDAPQGYDIVRNKSELENTPAWKAPKLLGSFSRPVPSPSATRSSRRVPSPPRGYGEAGDPGAAVQQQGLPARGGCRTRRQGRPQRTKASGCCARSTRWTKR